MIPSKVSCDDVYIPAALPQDTFKLYLIAYDNSGAKEKMILQ